MATKEFIESEVLRLRKNFATKKTLSYEWRRKQLEQIVKMCKERRQEIGKAIGEDLGSLFELVNLMEIGPVIQEAELAIENLKKWMEPEQKNVIPPVRPAKGYIYKQPFGLVCILSPWNYPFRLLLYPLIGAIGAGNAVMLKPSEVSKNTSAVVKKLIEEYLDKDFFSVIEGDVTVSTNVLAQRFDYILYTGNTHVGKIVMKAAAENLTPVTLELGGKCPAVVDKSCKIPATINRILSGKLQNLGQTCVSPDYVFVHNDIKDKFINELKVKIDEWYTKNPENVDYYSRIINENHTKRIQSLLSEVKSNIIYGGNIIVEKKFVQPTLVQDPPLSSKLMKEEIFGPVLPILGYSNLDDALCHINAGEKPLALYVFSEDNKFIDKVLAETSSGGACVNGTIFHIANPEIPFGGVGHSGMGQYNGKYSFDTFSHQRGVLIRSTFIDPSMSYPPYTKDKLNTFNMVADGIKIPIGAKITGAVSAIAISGYLLSKL